MGGRQRAVIVGGGIADELSDDTRETCDAVLVGLGAVAETGLAVSAGLDCGHGVHTDHDKRTCAPGIFAVGDVAEQFSTRHGGRVCAEQWQSAVRQGQRAAAAITGHAVDDEPVPCFWSDR